MQNGESYKVQSIITSKLYKYIVSSTVDRLIGLTDTQDTCAGEDFDGIDDE